MNTASATDRLATKNPQEAIIAEIQRDFNLTRIFARAHFDQMERYFRAHTALDLAHGQIAYEAVASEEPAAPLVCPSSDGEKEKPSPVFQGEGHGRGEEPGEAAPKNLPA